MSHENGGVIGSAAIQLQEEIRKNNQAFSKDVLPIQSTNPAIPRADALPVVDAYLGNFTHTKAAAIRRGLDNLAEISSRNAGRFSLGNLVEARGVRGADALFDPITGSLKISKESFENTKSPFAMFFTKDRVFQSEDGDSIELRGKNYYTALARRLNFNDRLDVMRADVRDITDILSMTGKDDIRSPEDFIYYQGMLDYLKVHATAAFHAFTAKEREGVAFAPHERARYHQSKKLAVDMMLQATRMQYQNLLGLEFDADILDTHDFQIAFTTTLNTIQQNMAEIEVQEGEGATNSLFRFPELHHPLTIALGAQEAVRRDRHIDIIAGIPTGGTETAIVAQLLNEHFYQRTPDLMFVPLSIHSGIKNSGRGQREKKIDSLIDENYSSPILHKRVLLIDDSSATGQTLGDIAARLEKRGASSVLFHVGEFDGRRWTGQATDYGNSKNKTAFNPDVSPSTMGIAPINGARHDFIEIILKRMGNGKNSMKTGELYIPDESVVNIASSGSSETSRMLSNFAETPFELDGVVYPSVESFWQSLYFPEGSDARMIVAGLSAREAKAYGKRRPKDMTAIRYLGHEVEVGSPEHHHLMRRAVKAKIEQNPHVRSLLLETGDKKITHVLTSRDRVIPESKTIPGSVFSQMLMDIRGELRDGGL